MMKPIFVENDMSKANHNRTSGRTLRQKRLAALLLGSMAVFSTTPAGASGYPVFDFSALIQALKDFKQSNAQLIADARNMASRSVVGTGRSRNIATRWSRSRG